MSTHKGSCFHTMASTPVCHTGVPNAVCLKNKRRACERYAVVPSLADETTVDPSGGPAIVKGAPLCKVRLPSVVHQVARPRFFFVFSPDVLACVTGFDVVSPFGQTCPLQLPIACIPGFAIVSPLA